MDASRPQLLGRVHVARQPIFDARGRIEGYELLYRSSETDESGRSDSAATLSTIVTAFVELGLASIVGSVPAWINVTEELICSDLLDVLPPDRVVLEILETVQPTSEVLERLDRYRTLGYRCALDDFSPWSGADLLLSRVDAVKLDVRALETATIVASVKGLHRRKLRLVAEKIETHPELAACRKLGFDLFQGRVFGRPRLSSATRLSTATASRVRMVAALRDPDVHLGQLEALIAQDVTLSYRLLTYINSAHVALARRVESMRDAIMFLGLDTVRCWATLLLLSDLDPGRPDLVESAAMRARMCELLSSDEGLRPDVGFTVGLLSRLDVLIGLELVDILDGLPLTSEVTDGLLGAGAYAGLLAKVGAYERGEFGVAGIADSGEVLAAAYFDAAGFARARVTSSR